MLIPSLYCSTFLILSNFRKWGFTLREHNHTGLKQSDFELKQSSGRSLRVLLLVPNVPGGIERLYSHIRDGKTADSSIHVEYFVSHDAKPMAVARFPGKLLHFAAKLLFTTQDLCHLNLSVRGSTLRCLCFSAIAGMLRKPYILHLHSGLYADFYRSCPPVVKRLISSMLRRAVHVIILSDEAQHFLCKEIGVSEKRVSYLPNAISAPATIPERSQHEAHLLYLGRLWGPKGTPELIEALASEELRSRNWKATLAGDGEIDRFRALVLAHGLQERVAIPGWVSLDEVKRLLIGAHILVHPSHCEAMPLAVLEGMGYGLAIVATPVGAVAQVIRSEENGILVEVGNTGELVAALCRMLDDSALRFRLATQARLDFEAEFDANAYRNKLDVVYRKALSTCSLT